MEKESWVMHEENLISPIYREFGLVNLNNFDIPNVKNKNYSHFEYVEMCYHCFLATCIDHKPLVFI